MNRESGDGTAPDAETDGEAGGETGGEYDPSSDEQTWGILTHAAGLAGFAVPFGNILGPLLVWLIKRDESRFVDENGKAALNFQLTWTVGIIVVSLTLLIGIGFVLVPIVILAWLVLVVVAMIRASDGQVYDYPLTIDLVS